MKKQHWMGIIAGILFASSANGQIGRLEWHSSFELPSTQRGKSHLGLAGAIAGVTDGVLLLGGGANFPDLPPWDGGSKKIQHDVFVYKKEGRKLSLLTQDRMPEGLAYGASLGLPRGLLVIGGETSKGKTSSCRLLKFDAHAKKIALMDYPDLPFPMANMGATYIGDKIFVAGGECQDGVSDQVLQLDLQDLASGWIQVGTLPYAVSHLQLVADNLNRLYVVGGRKANNDRPSTLYPGLMRSSDGGNHWTKLRDIPFNAAAGVACILPDNGLWLLSADRGDTFNRVEHFIFEAKNEPDPDKAQQLIHAKNQLQVNHPGFGREIWRYDLKLEKWNKMGQLPSDGPVTTTAVIWDDMVVIPSGEIKAGIRSPQILVSTFFFK